MKYRPATNGPITGWLMPALNFAERQMTGTLSPMVQVPSPTPPAQHGGAAIEYWGLVGASSFSRPAKVTLHTGPEILKSSRRSQIEALATAWAEGRARGGSAIEMAMHPAYLQIIGMGDAAVPLILRQLELKPDHWFIALWAITQTNPVPEQDAGKLKAMATDWIAWGRAYGYSW